MVHLIETQIHAADISSEKIRFATLVKCLDGRFLQQIEGVTTDPTTTGRYAELKDELIRILTDTDSARLKKLVESEEMGVRKSSEFYHHLRKLANPSMPDDFILTLWRNQSTIRSHQTYPDRSR